METLCDAGSFKFCPVCVELLEQQGADTYFCCECLKVYRITHEYKAASNAMAEGDGE